MTTLTDMNAATKAWNSTPALFNASTSTNVLTRTPVANTIAGTLVVHSLVLVKTVTNFFQTTNRVEM